MAWEWLIVVDAVLGLGVLGIAFYLALARRSLAAAVFSVTCFMASFRIFYFIIPALSDMRPTPGLAGIFPATENVLGIGLVATALALREDAWKSPARKASLAAVYLLGLTAILFLFQRDPADGPLPYVAPLFLATAFVASTAFAAAEWVTGPLGPRRVFVFVIGPLFSWSLNDALRIGHAALSIPADARSSVVWFTLIVAGLWLLALIVVFALLGRQVVRQGMGPAERLLALVLGFGLVFALLQMFTSDPNGMRAVHLVLDCSAIIAIGLAVARLSWK